MCTNNESTKYIDVPNPNIVKGGKLTGSCFGSGNFVLYRTLNKSKTNELLNAAPSAVQLLKPTSWYTTEDIGRNFIIKSANVFIKLQGAQEKRPLVVDACREYRNILLSCARGLYNELQEVSGERLDFIQQKIASSNSLAVIFHLAQILIFDTKSGLLIHRLLDWLAHGFPINTAVDRLKTEIESNSDRAAELAQDYWYVFRMFIMLGQPKNAEIILNWHSQTKNNTAVVVMKRILQNMPNEMVANSTGLSEFKNRWTKWQSEIKSQIELGIFDTIAELSEVAKLLCGYKDSGKIIYDQCENWYHFMIASLLFTDPTIQMSELPEQVEKFKRMYQVKDNLAINRIITAIFNNDILQTLLELKENSEAGWAAAHMIDLLYHSGAIANLNINDQRLRNAADSMRERYLLDYGELLINDPNLWSIGIKYLDSCATLGQNVISLVLPTIINNTNENEIIHELNERNLTHICQVIYAVKARKMLCENQLGHALVNALKAEDSALCTKIADKILEKFSEARVFECGDIIESLGSAVTISDRLAFLYKYREMIIKLQDNNLQESCEIFMDLVKSGCTPLKLIPILLKESLALMQRDKDLKYFTSEDLYRLLAVLEEARSSKVDMPDYEIHIRHNIIKKISITEINELM